MTANLNLNPYEMEALENGNAWQKALVAIRHDLMSELTTEELNHILETVAERDFYAEMSDSYQTTLHEIRQNHEIADAAKKELARR